MTPVTDPLAAAREIADAVLYEGYVLFPYRASATKNRYRWQWGVLVPTLQVEAGATEPSQVGFDVPARSPDVVITAHARFLHLQHRQVVDPDGHVVERAELDGELHLTWDEGVERQVSSAALRVGDLLEAEHTVPFSVEGSTEHEGLAGGWALRRTCEPLQGVIEIRAHRTGATEQHGPVRISVDVRNTTPWSERRAHRDQILRRSLVGTHVLLSARGGPLASVVDPAAWADETADHCRSRGIYPVLVGDDDAVVLAAPIILDDHPEIAPESPGPSFDGLEIDELLALCVQGLTDEEKREARATDRRAAELIDRTDSLPPAVLERLHGTVRPFDPVGLQPEPEAGVTDEIAELFGVGEHEIERIAVGGCDVGTGDRVRLRPNRRADAHDLFADGREATVERIVRTVDDETMLAVTLVDDPAADLHRWYGRFQYFHLDEVEPVTAKEPGT